MGKRVMRQKRALADYPHKYQQLSCPRNCKPKPECHHADFYHGNQGTDVTLFQHLPPQKHSYDPELLNKPAAYYGREGCDVTDYQRYISGMNPPEEDYYYGIHPTDISGHLKIDVPSIDNPNNGVYWGCPKTHVTNPSVSPNLTPPQCPLDGKGTKGSMDWPAQSREDQVPLGKAMSKFELSVRTIERSQKAEMPPKPRPPRGPLSGEVKHCYSPGYPVGRSDKPDFQQHASLKIKIPKDTDGLYWGRTKSYITDYAVSPTLTPPHRPLDGAGARHAMMFVSTSPQIDDKIPLGRAISRIKRSSPSTGTPLKLESPKFRPQTVKYPIDQKGSPSTPCKNPSWGRSPPSGKASGPCSGEPSPRLFPPGAPCSDHASTPTSAPSSASSRGTPCKLTPKPCKEFSEAKSKARQDRNIRTHDQISFAKTSEQWLETTSCDNQKPCGLLHRPALADIKCPNTYRGPSMSPKPEQAQIKLVPGFHKKLLMKDAMDPHHDQEWHGRAKCSVTDYSVPPNLTPPGRQSFRTKEEKAESVARFLAKREPKRTLPPKPPHFQKPPIQMPRKCNTSLHREGHAIQVK